MKCPICYHEWCWVCGFPRKHCFHKAQLIGGGETGIVCSLVNSFRNKVKFEKWNFLLQMIFMILITALGPLIFAAVFPVVMLLYGILLWFVDLIYKNILKNKCTCCRVLLAIFLNLVVFPIFVALISAAIALITAVFFVMSQIILLMILPRTLYVNFLKSRRMDNKEELTKQYELSRVTRLQQLQNQRIRGPLRGSR